MPASHRFSSFIATLPLLAATCISLTASVLSAQSLSAQESGQTLFKNVRVFDGTRSIGTRDVLVSAGKIAAISSSLRAPTGATIVDGSGSTLLPGLIDSHTHVFGDALEQALAFGVTTELDMFSDPGEGARLRAEQKAHRAAGRADIYSAGVLVTAPKGHGTEYGFPIPTLASPDSAVAFVDARIAEDRTTSRSSSMMVARMEYISRHCRVRSCGRLCVPHMRAASSL